MQLSRLVDLVLKKLQEQAKPKKGKKTSAALSSLVADLKTARQTFKEKLEELTTMLAKWNKADDDLSSGSIADLVDVS